MPRKKPPPAEVAASHCPSQLGRVLSTRKDMADLLVGVCGDFVPAGEVLRTGYLLNLFRRPSAGPPSSAHDA